MGKKDILVEYLKNYTKKKYITAKKLSNVLGVSDRTVRNYVKSLNEEQKDLIQSSNNGYKINNKYSIVNKYYKNKSNKSYAYNRYFYIIRRLIKSSNRGLDLFDLSDTLYVSDATIRKDISEINQSIIEYNLKIIQQGNRFILKGSEKDRRKLMVSLINDDSKGDTLSLDKEIQAFLESVSIQELKKVSNDAFEKHSIKIDSYFFRNFILHLAISVSRSADNGNLKDEVTSLGSRNSKGFIIIEEITFQLYKKYNINLSQADRDELVTLFINQINGPEEVDNYVTTNVYHALEHAIQEISNVYMIDFNNNNFKSYLFIHVQNLYNRFMKDKYARNLSVLNIKIKYPIIFDIAVYLSSILSNDLNIKINDDEIAFISLHIGSYLNNKPKSNDQRIETVIITPDYLMQQKDIYDFIQNEFKDDLLIIGMYEYINDIDITSPPKLIITTENIKQDIYNNFKTEIEIVNVREFITRHDVATIRKSIEKVNHEKYKEFLEIKLPALIKEDYFIKVSDNISKNQIMETISSVFKENNYVKTDYLEQLKKREKVSSTAYPSGVAIPHTMKYEGKGTGLIIILPEDKIHWHDLEVELIIGLTVNEDDSYIFNLIFPRIVELVAESYNIKYLIESTTRNNFINRLIELMLQDNFYP